MRPLLKIFIIAICTLLVASCSTTRRLPEGEILYTGAKPLKVHTPEGEKAAPGLGKDLKAAINVPPNNCLYSPYYRYPFPLGLWVYNNWNDPGHGFKHWLYDKLVAEPVLISDVRPEVRVKMIDEILRNNGYFSGSASYDLVQGKNKRKASIRYNISTGQYSTFDTIMLLPHTSPLADMIDSLALKSKYLRPGERYCTDSLSAERVRITNRLRNHGYFFFKPEYIEYLADTTITPGKVALKMVMADNVPPFALQSYKVGRVITTINRHEGGGEPDTFYTKRSEVILMQPAKFRRGLIDENITFRQGRTFSVRDMNRTQTYLSRLGIFEGIDITPIPDTTAVEPTLNVLIDCTFAAPWQANFEVNVSSKSNSYLGPGVRFGLTNRNLWGGGEQFNATVTGSYEWETGRGRSSIFNSYEVGLSTSLSFPRLLAPRFVKRRRYAQNWTHVTLSGDLLNRPHYFMLGQVDGALTYDWQYSRYASNTLSLLKLTYTNLMRSTTAFDSIMQSNPAVALSFRSQFIPQVSWTYNYSRLFNRVNQLDISVTLQEAGNLCWAIWRACGVPTGSMKLLRTPFSQFVKGTAQLVYGRRLSSHDIWLVNRAAIGAAHAYGNASVVPYSEQFYVGGANSIRAFTVRSLGPGSYHTDEETASGYFDQTGTFRLELNSELRFPIIGPVHGAVFLDAGNIWLLKADPSRPGGELKASTFLRDIALGTGVGLRLDVGIIVVRGDLGIGIHAPYDTGKRGYYNMPKFGRSLAFHLAIGYPF